jgi:hypothetical protein
MKSSCRLLLWEDALAGHSECQATSGEVAGHGAQAFEVFVAEAEDFRRSRKASTQEVRQSSQQRNNDHCRHAANVKRDPTLLVASFSGIRRRIASMKLVPEQCIGKTTSGFNSTNSSIVCSI